jgi:hypothetical protein
MSNALLAMIAARKAAVSRIKTIKPAAGRSRYRILPSWRVLANAPAHLSRDSVAGMPSEAEQWASEFFREFGQHFLKNAAGEIKAVTICSDKTFGTPCSVCSELERAIEQSVDDAQVKRLKDAQSTGRILMNVLHLDGPTPGQVQILECPPSVLYGKKGVGGLVSAFADWPNLLDLTNGADVIIERQGTGLLTEYGVSVVPSQTKVGPEHLAKLQDLDAFVKIQPDALQRAIAATSAVTGLLPAPTATLAGAAAAAFAAAPAAAPATETILGDIPDFPAAAAPAAPAPAPVQAPAPVAAPAPAAAAPAAPSASEDDLEELLKGL